MYELYGGIAAQVPDEGAFFARDTRPYAPFCLFLLYNETWQIYVNRSAHESFSSGIFYFSISHKRFRRFWVPSLSRRQSAGNTFLDIQIHYAKDVPFIDELCSVSCRFRVINPGGPGGSSKSHRQTIGNTRFRQNNWQTTVRRSGLPVEIGNLK